MSAILRPFTPAELENNNAKAAAQTSSAETELGGHTPGPWALSHVYSSVAGWSRWEYQIHIGDEPLAEIPDRAPVAAANARLIAAAPDMLAALKAMVECSDDLGVVERPGSPTAQARAAIAKATGAAS